MVEMLLYSESLQINHHEYLRYKSQFMYTKIMTFRFLVIMGLCDVDKVQVFLEVINERERTQLITPR